MSGELKPALKKRVDEYLSGKREEADLLDILDDHDEERDAVTDYIERRDVEKAGEKKR